MMSVQIEKCAGCGREIGPREHAYLWRDQVVCEACYVKLSKLPPPPPRPLPPRPEPPRVQSHTALLKHPGLWSGLAFLGFLALCGILWLSLDAWQHHKQLMAGKGLQEQKRLENAPKRPEEERERHEGEARAAADAGRRQKEQEARARRAAQAQTKKEIEWFVRMSAEKRFTGPTDIRPVKGEVEGRHYESVQATSQGESISVLVGSRAEFFIHANDGFLGATGFIQGYHLQSLISLLEKGLEWSEKAKAIQFEGTKELGAFETVVDKHTFIPRKQGICLGISSINEGRRTVISIEVLDFSNMFKKATLRIEPEEVRRLITLLENVPSTFKELRRQQQKAKELR